MVGGVKLFSFLFLIESVDNSLLVLFREEGNGKCQQEHIYSCLSNK